jgi:histidyl-tRNA synthetase
MAEPIQAVKGMNDILAPDSARWEWFEDTVRALMRRYGYLNIRTPIVEPTPLFVRGLGEVTDIVEKEMYSFIDSMNGDPLTLRPEGTAGVVRAAIEHSMLYDGGKRLYYIGPMFRHERPQRGRYRQFHQVGVEALGFGGPDVDAEVILMCRSLWRDLGLSDVRLDINCLGQSSERKAHREALIRHLEGGRDLLDAEAQRRLHSNPLRILDTKNPAMQGLVEAAPRLMDFLGEASLKHFEGVCKALDAAGQAYGVNHRLVRGMDYYSLTVFEWVTDRLGAQGTVCGGGRYDGLAELDRRQARAGHWLGHGHGTRAGLVAAVRCAAARCGARCVCRGAVDQRLAAGHAGGRSVAGGRCQCADARGRQGCLGQHEVAIQEGRRQRCAPRTDLWRPGTGPGPGGRQALA